MKANIEIRKEFPFINQGIIYMDSAATSLKPNCVIDSQSEYYKTMTVNVGRGSSIHNFNTTNIVEKTRNTIAQYLNITDETQVIFTQNSTDSINMVANGWVRQNITSNSNIVITQLEHHSNYVPWIELCKELNIECRIVPLENYEINYSKLIEYINEHTLITAITGMSNITGIETNLEVVTNRCREVGSKIIIDAAQLIVHKRIDIQQLDPDFLVFSAHKLYGPFGLGILYGKKNLLEEMTPVRYGGNMVSYTSNLTNIHYKDIPFRLESGTQNPAAIYSFSSVFSFIKDYDIEETENYIKGLSTYLIHKLKEEGDIIVYSQPGSIISFNIQGVHPHDASQFFDEKNIILRTGNLCASPFFANLEESGVIRVSLGVHNNIEEIDTLLIAIKEIKGFFL